MMMIEGRRNKIEKIPVIIASIGSDGFRFHTGVEVASDETSSLVLVRRRTRPPSLVRDRSGMHQFSIFHSINCINADDHSNIQRSQEKWILAIPDRLYRT
jgi:hypothetical protein